MSGAGWTGDSSVEGPEERCCWRRSRKGCWASFMWLRASFRLKKATSSISGQVDQRPDPAGHSIHEMGTLHMGSDAKTSVLNQFNQSWDVRNLFVVDAASFTSGTHKNPTLTIMALSWRAAEYMLAEMKKGSW